MGGKGILGRISIVSAPNEEVHVPLIRSALC